MAERKDRKKNKIKKWITKIRLSQNWRYRYLLSCWSLSLKWRRAGAFIRRHFASIRRILFVAVAVGIACFIKYKGGVNFTQDIISNYLVAIGAMAGGMIAIVFTISIFLLQNAADLYSSQYLEVYIHDWREKFIYSFIVLITLFFFGGGLAIGSLNDISQNAGSFIVYLSLFLISLIFILIDWQYENVRKKINPSEAINFLEKEGKDFLKKVHSEAKRMAIIIQARDGSTSKEQAIANAYNHFLQPFTGDLDRQLENLVEISTKLSDRQEVGTTKRGLWAVYNILIAFLKIRKSSSLIIPSRVALFAMESDSQPFFTNNFERLNKAGEKFAREGKDELSSFIIKIYNALATKAKDIHFIGRFAIGNPILDHIVGYLNAYIDYGQRTKNVEMLYQGSRALSNIAVVSSEMGFETTLRTIQDKLLEIAMSGLIQNQTIIVNNCIDGYIRIIKSIFIKSKKFTRKRVENSLKNISKIAYSTTFLMKKGILPNDYTTWTSLCKGYDDLHIAIVDIMDYYFQLKDEKEKEKFGGDILVLFKDINLDLRQLSENLKECDSILTDSICNLIFNVNQCIVDLLNNDEVRKYFEGEAEVRLEWNIHLPYWFVHYSEKFDGGSNSFDTLTDGVAKTGILAVEKLNNKKLAAECISCLNLIANECLDKTESRYGFDEPRVLEKACYLGILALKKGWEDVFIQLVLDIYDFEKKYFKKYFSDIPDNTENHNVIGLHKDQLFRELLRWRDGFTGEKYRNPLRDTAEDMMCDFIDRIDIDRFMFEVWGRFPSGSEVEEEINLKYGRLRFINFVKGIYAKKKKEDK